MCPMTPSQVVVAWDSMGSEHMRKMKTYYNCGIGCIRREDTGRPRPNWATSIAGARRNFRRLRDAKAYLAAVRSGKQVSGF